MRGRDYESGLRFEPGPEQKPYVPLARMQQASPAGIVGMFGALVSIAGEIPKTHMGSLQDWPRERREAIDGIPEGGKRDSGMDCKGRMK